MSSGFNTDVRAGERVFHVQTEDRGPAHFVIDTAVYLAGRVVLRRSADYTDFAASSDFTPESLRRRVEDQHRKLIEELRAGTLDAQIATGSAPARPEPGSPPARPIKVQLLNPTSWLSAGHVLLDVEILRRDDNSPPAAARVEAVIEGALEETRHSAECDAQGRVRIQFPLPPLGKGDLTLVIQGRADSSADEIRFVMRSRAKSAPSDSEPAGAMP
jgi:hypothetical protein